MTSPRYRCIEHVVPGQHIRQYPRSTSSSQEATLQLSVKQYIPNLATGPQAGDITIIAAHGIGCPKELYEALWDELYDASCLAQEFRIRGIWIADASNQGKSGVLNEAVLGNEPSWYDNARDYLAIINHFRADMPRPLVGIGHSMGGNVIVNLALMHPRLLSTVVVYEPVINMNSATMEFSALGPMTTKPDMWPSRKEAEVYFRKNKFYAKWDPRAMDAWLKYGLRPLPTALYPMTTDEHSGAVTLVTTRHQEALSFARAAYPPPGSSMKAFNPTSSAHPDLGLDRNPQNLFYRPEVTSTYAQLAYLRPSCYYIYGDRSHLSSAVAQERAAKFVITGTGTGGNGGFRKGGVKETLVSGSHFVPLERPGEIASLMNAWLSSEIRRWREEEKAESTARKALPAEKRATVSDEWYYWIQKVAKPIGTTSKL